MAGKASNQVQLAAPLNRVWAAFNDPTLIPKVLPGFVESVEILEGDGESAGSIRKLNFSAAVPHATFLKEKIEAVDPESHTLVMAIVEGGSIGTDFSSLKTTIKFSAGEADSTILDWELEYEAIVADPPVAKAKEGSISTFKAIEAYLTANVNEYST